MDSDKTPIIAAIHDEGARITAPGSPCSNCYWLYF
jgi:hypothetical protein